MNCRSHDREKEQDLTRVSHGMATDESATTSANRIVLDAIVGLGSISSNVEYVVMESSPTNVAKGVSEVQDSEVSIPASLSRFRLDEI